LGTREENDTLQRHVPCPFCGLGCDDLAVSVDGDSAHIAEGGCARSREGFQRAAAAPSGAEASVGGEAASLDAAIAEAARLLKASRRPLFAGLGADGHGIRSAIGLADRLGGALDHMDGDALMNHVHTLQDSGWVTTTLSELRNRADFVVVLGTPVLEQAPRLFERFIRPPQGLFPDRLERRRVVAVGQPEDGAEAGDIDETLTCPPEAVGEVAEALHSLASGHALQAEAIGGIPRTALESLAERLLAADYSVIVWAAGAMAEANRDLTVGAICDLVRGLNRTTRSAGLALGGDNGGQTALQATTWQTGFPLRVQFPGGYPEYAPFDGSARGLLARGDADALVWISAFDHRTHPPATDVPTIVLGQGGMAPPGPPAVYIPVGTPGIDHGGPHFRCDGSVSLPLRGLRSPAVPSVGEVLTRIEAQLTGEEA
jgi:formylmethanofuran dehydrogenase subunit B